MISKRLGSIMFLSADTFYDFHHAGARKYEGTAGAGDKTDPTGT